MKRTRSWFVIVIIIFQLTIIPAPSHAFGGAATIPFILQLIAQAIKQYQQLKLMLDQAKDAENLVRSINDGLDNAIDLLASLPIEDENILTNLKSFGHALSSIEKLYGIIPHGPDSDMFKLHDQTIAESLKIISYLNDYADKQEKNATSFQRQSHLASPKGAARMNMEVNATILHTLNQLLKVNGQMLKLQSEQFGISNKLGKESAYHYQKVGSDIRESLSSFQGNFDTPRFEE